MQETLDTSIIESAKQIILGFGGFMGLAILLGMTGDRLHALLRGRFGRGYDYLICPGTLCSAFARRLACFVTGVKARDYLVVGGNGATAGAFVPRTASTRRTRRAGCRADAPAGGTGRAGAAFRLCR